MIFGSVPVQEAVGGILAHSLRASGRRLSKGTLLDGDDVAALMAAGVDRVTVARLEPDDVPENEAAEQLAGVACGFGLRARTAFTGRANLIAEVAGLAVVDEDRILAANRVDEAVTLCTLRPLTPVRRGELVATAKIIPLAVRSDVLARARVPLEDGEPAVRIAAFRPHRAGLVLTTLPGTRPALLERSEAVTRGRLEALGSTLDGVRTCEHREEAVAEALGDLLDAGLDPVLVLGASVAVDREDVVPRAMVQAGARVERFGIPVDPGNLLILARVGETAVVGVPGCARSPRRSGLDQVLERILAGLHPAPGDLDGLAVGGLLTEIPGRPQPRERKPGPEGEEGAGGEEGEVRCRVGAVVLAAGRSRRMGKSNKLLEPVGGVAMVARVVDDLLTAGAHPVVVVTGHEAGAVEGVLRGRAIQLAHNPDYARGMSTSLRRGIEALGTAAHGALVCLGDMPEVDPATLRALMAAFQEADPGAGGEVACVPVHSGKRGNPVLLGSGFFTSLASVQGDVGARGLLAEHPGSVLEVPVDDPGVLLDVDTREALLRLRGGGPGPELQP